MTEANAARQRRYRRRQRVGLAVWSLQVAEDDLRNALIAAGLVDEAATEADYRAAAEAVIDGFVRQFSVTRYGTWLAARARIEP